MRVAALVAALGLVAAPLCAGVETRAADGRVRIEARAAPLCDVLDDLARHTGMKVAYEGAPPRDLVTATLDRGSLVEALLAVFEGLDLTYVIQLDATGSGVAKLVMVANGSRGPGTAGTPLTGRMASAARPPVATDPVPEFSDPETDESLQEPIDPSSVVRDRVATDPRTGEPYPTPPDRPPEDAPQPRSDVHVQGYPTPGAPSGIRARPGTPFMRFPQGLPSPQPQPTPAAP
jgi:hypothetical protein